MIFNKDIIFIHIGKTGGQSCAHYLLNNLNPPVYNCHKNADEDLKFIKDNNVIPITDVDRHCTLSEALDVIKNINGFALNDFKKVFAVVRHPYSLEFSFYNHLKKPHVRAQREGSQLLEIAEKDFVYFAKHAGYHREGVAQDDFFRINGEIPEQVKLIRFEELEVSFVKETKPFIKEGKNHPFDHRNYTVYQSTLVVKLANKIARIFRGFSGSELKRPVFMDSPKNENILRNVLTKEARDIIYKKHQYMFDSGIYSRDF